MKIQMWNRDVTWSSSDSHQLRPVGLLSAVSVWSVRCSVAVSSGVGKLGLVCGLEPSQDLSTLFQTPSYIAQIGRFALLYLFTTGSGLRKCIVF
jgi:hypothetical protein